MTAEYLGRIKGMKTLKQIIAEGIVTPASALEERKAQVSGNWAASLNLYRTVL